MNTLPRHVEIHEEGPRAGPQTEPKTYPLAERAALVDALAAAGLAQIQVASFVSPKRVPQMADAAELFAAIRKRPGTRYTALWLNEAGYERARSVPQVDLVGTLYFYASDAFSRQNSGRGAAQMAQEQRQWVQRYREAALPIEAAYLMTAFGCTLEGEIPEARLAEALRAIAALLRDEDVTLPKLVLADTVGWAHPLAIRRRVELVRTLLPGVRVGLHLHDTRGLGIANAYAALEMGVDLFDASVAGLGGCPFCGHAHGSAAGNVCTEDLVFLCHELGIATGIDLKRCSRRRAGRAPHRPPAGRQADARRHAGRMAAAMIGAAGQVSLAGLFRERARAQPDAPALSDGRITLSYAQLVERVQRLAGGLHRAGLQAGERLAVLSENRLEVVELELAAATLGAIIACLNWRLAGDEQRHCIRLVTPRMVFVSPRHADALAAIDHGVPQVLVFGDDFERLRAGAALDPLPDIDAEAGLVILYTSGTTGLPKGALISQRAMVARAMVYAADYGIGRAHSHIAWSPLFHMAATDHALATLLLGGRLHIADGLDLERIAQLLCTEPVGWLLAMPGVIEPLIDTLRPITDRLIPPRMVGAMADLVPRAQIAELTRLVKAPYLNTFGSTETGLPPASGALLAAGEAPVSLSKRVSSMCQLRLVDADGREVGIDEPGEMTLRTPTLFSGY